MNYLCKWETTDIILRHRWISTCRNGIPPQHRGITGDDILGSYRGNKRFSEVEIAYFRVDNAIPTKLLINICMIGHQSNIYSWVKLWVSDRVIHVRAYSLRLSVKANVSENGPVSIVSVPIRLLSLLPYLLRPFSVICNRECIGACHFCVLEPPDAAVTARRFY